MQHKKELARLNEKSVATVDEYLKTKKNLSKEHYQKLSDAKKKWQTSWSDLMDVLMYLETLEI